MTQWLAGTLLILLNNDPLLFFPFTWLSVRFYRQVQQYDHRVHWNIIEYQTMNPVGPCQPWTQAECDRSDPPAAAGLDISGQRSTISAHARPLIF